MNIEFNLDTDPFFSQKRFGKTIMQQQEWANLKCNDCGGELELKKDNEYEEVKVCQNCGSSAILIKKIRKTKGELRKNGN